MSKSYKRRRREAWPPVGDQLDALWKFVNQLRLSGAADLPQETDDMLNKVLRVKRDIPKPEKESGS